MKRNAGKNGKHNRQETSGNPYFARPMLGKSQDVRVRQRMNNDYGKSPANMEKSREGLYDSPLRTIRSPVP